MKLITYMAMDKQFIYNFSDQFNLQKNRYYTNTSNTLVCRPWTLSLLDQPDQKKLIPVSCCALLLSMIWLLKIIDCVKKMGKNRFYSILTFLSFFCVFFFMYLTFNGRAHCMGPWFPSNLLMPIKMFKKNINSFVYQKQVLYDRN